MEEGGRTADRSRVGRGVAGDNYLTGHAMIQTSFCLHNSDIVEDNTRIAGRLEEDSAGIEESARDESLAGDD